MPQTGTSFWYAEAEVINDEGETDIDSYNKLINNIGNLFVIDPLTNNQVKNYDYDIKKAFYQEHLNDWSIARVTSLKDDWKKLAIEERANEIAGWAKDYWAL